MLMLKKSKITVEKILPNGVISHMYWELPVWNNVILLKSDILFLIQILLPQSDFLFPPIFQFFMQFPFLRAFF